MGQIITYISVQCISIPIWKYFQKLSDWFNKSIGIHDFNTLLTTHTPIIFAFHDYPYLIHRLTYRRNNHKNLYVRGYKEEGTITTPFDMAVRNDIDRFRLVGDVVDRVPKLRHKVAYLKQFVLDKLIEHRQYITQRGEDMPEIREWQWPYT